MSRRATAKAVSFELASALESFLDEYAYSAPRTEQSYREYLAPFRRWCEKEGIRTVAEVRADDIRAYLRTQRDYRYERGGELRPLALSTLQRRYGTVHTFFEWCVKDGRIEYSPVTHVRRPRGEEKARFGFTDAEKKRLISETKRAPGRLKYRDTALLMAAIGTGARASELCGLRWQDIHWAEGYLVVYGKGGKERRLRMSRELARALRRWQEQCPVIPGNYVWVTIRRTPMSGKGFWTWMKNLGDYAGVENCHPHRLRHTFAADFTRLNRDVYATKARLGHAQLKTTERYLHSLGVDYGMDESYRTPDQLLAL